MSVVQSAAASSTPTRWATTIGEICDRFGGEVQTGPFGSQLHAADYSEVGTPVVMPQDMQDGRIVTDRIARVDSKHVERLRQHKLRLGDVVYSRRGDVGRFAVVSETEAGWLCGTGSIRIRLNCPDIDIAYVRRYLQQPAVSKWLGHHAKGVTMPNLNTTIIRALPFVHPPLPEQRRIAAILDEADALRAKRRAALAQLDTLTQSIFLDMFGDPTTNPRDWPDSLRLGDVADVVSGVTIGRSLAGKSTRMVPYLAVMNVQDRRLNLTSVKATLATEEEIARYRLHENDLLLTEGGDPDKLGRGTLWNCPLPECIHQNHVFRVRLQGAAVTPLFLNWLVGSERGKRYFLRSAKQTTGIASINMTQLRAFPLLTPPMALQVEFGRRFAEVERLRRALKTGLDEVECLFASLQHAAFQAAL